MSASARQLEGERKQVTVLFLDVQGSMDLAGSVDPEAWRSIMGRFFELVCEEVHRFEGTVDKFTGDGAMALFGAPIAHEDHAARACYAGLHLRDRLHDYAAEVRRDHGLSFSVRMGLNSGEVVVGSVGSDQDLEYTAIGNTVGLAARMESVAEPGKPCLTSATAALVEGYFELEDLGELRVKGAAEPVRAYALIGTGDARTRLEAAGAGGLSRFVGRDREMAALDAALERAEESGQVVGVVAEPGLGKSRLCREFVERCRARGLEVTEGRGVAHGRRIPLLPVVEMMRAYYGIGDSDDGREARQKIAGKLLLLDEAFRDALPVLFDFLGVPDREHPASQMSPEARQRALFGVVRRVLETRADADPGVLVVEDLHWLDPGSDAFLANLVESVSGSRTLVVVNFRPEYRADWMQKSYYQQLPLVPLSGEAVEAMVRNLLGDDASLDGLSELVAERTSGNPFFIEEVIQGLVESGTLAGSRGDYRLVRSIEAIEIPPTVQAVLAARIDRLAEREKSVLHSASVIGREFSEPVLRVVTGLPEHELSQALAELRAAELVYEKTLYPEAEYAFKHPLTEEVAYRSQLGERRAAVHAAVADALEELYADRLDELAGLVANHREHARDAVAAARWSARAAVWAGQHHPADALRHWRRVRSLLSTERSSLEAVTLRLSACSWILQFGWRLGLSDQEIEEVYADGRALAEATDEPAALASVQAAYGTARGMVGAVDDALRCLREAMRLAEGVEELQLPVATGAAYWLQMSGRPAQALAEADALMARAGDRLELGRELIGFSIPIWLNFFRGLALTELGRLDDAAAGFRRAMELAREHDDVETLGWAQSNLAGLAYFRGDAHGDAVDHGRRGLEIAERLGSSFSLIGGTMWFAYVRFARGEWAEGRSEVERALDEMRRTRTGLQYEPGGLALLSEAQLEMGEFEAAQLTAEKGIATAVRAGIRTYEGSCRWALGRALLAGGDVGEQPETEFTKALEYWRRRAPGMEPWAHEALADLAAARGVRDDELRRLKRARELYAEQGATGRLRRIDERLAALGVAAA